MRSQAGPDEGVTPIPDAEILRHLERLLASDMFKASKRCRAFLRYVVEQRVAGRIDNLREKVIGVEAFGRSLGYDTADDPVVRTTAGEVRKRLAQYYQEPDRAADLRIELLSGSYVPEFHRGVVVESGAAPAAVAEEPANPGERPGTAPRRWLLWAAALPVLLGVGAVIWRSSVLQPAVFDRFWAPTLRAHGPVLLSVGQARVYSLRKDLANRAEAELDPNRTGNPAWGLRKDFPLTPADVFPAWDRYIPMGDAMSLTAMAVFLHGRGREYRLRGSGTTTLAELREGAAVLFGAFSNDWTLRVNKDLRFHVALDPNGWRYIEDRHDPASRRWKGTHVNVLPPAEYVDYAVITRVFEQTTGHPVTSVGGITHLGTLAAGEFLLSPEAMGEALRDAPPGWEAKNLQIVVSTKVIGASASPPRLLALHVW